MSSRLEMRTRAEQLLEAGKLFEAAQAFYTLGLADRALELLELLLATAPHQPAYLLLAGQCHAARGEHDQAVLLLQKLCKLGDSTGEAHHELARSLTALGEYDSALFHLGEALHLDPTCIAVYQSLTLLLWEVHKPKAALLFLKRAAASLPAAEIYSLLARAAVLAEDRTTAHEAMAWLREQTPESCSRALELGSLHLTLGEQAEARAEYELAIALEPSSPEPWHGLATLSVEQERHEEAEAHFRTALSRDAGHWPSLNDFGLLLLTDGRVAESVKLLRRAVTQHPQEAASHLNLSLALLASGARVAARHHARAALSLATEAHLAAQAAELVRQLG